MNNKIIGQHDAENISQIIRASTQIFTKYFLFVYILNNFQRERERKRERNMRVYTHTYMYTQ